MRKALYAALAATMLTGTLGMSAAPAEARLRDKIKTAAKAVAGQAKANPKSFGKGIVRCAARQILKKAGRGGC
jgi:hypothetical protein